MKCVKQISCIAVFLDVVLQLDYTQSKASNFKLSSANRFHLQPAEKNYAEKESLHATIAQ